MAFGSSLDVTVAGACECYSPRSHLGSACARSLATEIAFGSARLQVFINVCAHEDIEKATSTVATAPDGRKGATWDGPMLQNMSCDGPAY